MKSTLTSHSDSDYNSWLGRISTQLRAGEPLFTTDATGLFDAYLSGFPETERQYHNCNACRHFFERYAGLVTIDENGIARPAVWNSDIPEGYGSAVSWVCQLVLRSKVTGVFLSKDKVLGTPVTGQWRHFAMVQPKPFASQILEAHQAMAEKKEDFKNVLVALSSLSIPLLNQAVALLETDSLYRSEKILGQAQWLRKTLEARNLVKGKSAAANVLWRAIALAPAGFCHPRSSMIGTLLEDLTAGLPFDDVARKFKAKMHPLQYQRPTAEPKAGNIAQAEQIFAQMGLARSLERRYARLEELDTIWDPAPEVQQSSAGLFGHLKQKERQLPSVVAPPVPITWDKFHRTVIPNADRIEYYLSNSALPFVSIVTAVHADAPPILQWNNPFSWYFWHGGRFPAHYRLKHGWCPVTAVSLKPSMWEGGFSHQGKGAIFFLEGAKETQVAQLCLFPEILRSELHGVRSVIEAHNRTAKIQGLQEGSAFGIMFAGDKKSLVRVTSRGVQTTYELDRWD